MSVYEVMPFHDEEDLLAARVELMAGRVAAHVICEGDRTFQGAAKGYLYPHGLPGRRGDVASIRVELPAVATPWEREATQRDGALPFLVGLAAGDPDALVLSCDVDEFVDPEALERIWHACGDHRQVALGMRNIVFGGWENEQTLWHARAFRARNAPTSLHQLAAAPLHGVADCGWHLTWLGDVDRRRRKAMAFSHSECQPGYPIWRWIEKGRPDPTGTPHRRLDDLSDLPEVLQHLVAATNGDHP
jgi:hypothetical protein